MSSWAGEPYFAEQLAMRGNDLDVHRRIELCQKALALGLPPDQQVRANAYMGLDHLQLGEIEQGMAFMEHALNLDAQSPSQIFSDFSNRKAFFPTLEVVYLQQGQTLRDEQGAEAVASFIMEQLTLFEYLPGEHMPALLVELGAFYTSQNQSAEARKAYERALRGENLQEIDQVAAQIAQANLDRLDKEDSLQRAGNRLITVVAVLAGISVLSWILGWFLTLFPYLLVLSVIYYFGRHSYRLVICYGWTTRAVQAVAISAVPSISGPVLLVVLGKTHNIVLLVSLGLMLVTLTSSIALEYWAYRRHNVATSTVHPFTELREELSRHWCFVRNTILLLISRARWALFSEAPSSTGDSANNVKNESADTLANSEIEKHPTKKRDETRRKT